MGKPIRDPIRKFSLFNAFFEIIGLACGLQHADWFLPSEIMTFMPQANPPKSGLGNPQAARNPQNVKKTKQVGAASESSSSRGVFEEE